MKVIFEGTMFEYAQLVRDCCYMMAEHECDGCFFSGKDPDEAPLCAGIENVAEFRIIGSGDDGGAQNVCQNNH